MGPLKQPVWVIINEVPLTQWGVNGIPEAWEAAT
jgi:phenylpyruvate tautomerase PptA (4-oxalocrotonate tautomerase family)